MVMWRLAVTGLTSALHLAQALGSVLNVTVDDQYGDPTTGLSVLYSPSSKWEDGQSCDNCTAQPNATNAYMQTWKIGTYTPGEDVLQASFSFTGMYKQGRSSLRLQSDVCSVGIAIYVSCIVTGSLENPDGNTDLTFYIDNANVGSFEKTPDGNATYLYGTNVFATKGLSNTLHTLTIESGSGGSEALVMLDSITYTYVHNFIHTNPLSNPPVQYSGEQYLIDGQFQQLCHPQP